MAARPWVPRFLSQLLNNAQDIGDEIAAAEAKTELVDGDGIAVSNSEDGDILVEWTYASLKAQLKTFFTGVFDLLYQPLSSALTKITEAGGLPLWDGGAWPGGGGGSAEWSPIADVTIAAATNGALLENVFTDAYTRYRIRVKNMKGFSGNFFVYMQFGHSVVPVMITAYSYFSDTSTSNNASRFATTGQALTQIRVGPQATATKVFSFTAEILNLRNVTDYPVADISGTGVDFTSGEKALVLDHHNSINYLAGKLDHFKLYLSGGTFDSAGIIIEGAN